MSERLGWFSFIDQACWMVLIAVAVVLAALVFLALWFAVALVFHLRFQFSLQSLFVLVVVVAIPCSWLPFRLREVERQRAAAAAIEKLGGRVEWVSTASKHPAWLRDLLGIDSLDSVHSVDLAFTYLTDARMKQLTALRQLRKLRLDHTNVIDADLEHLKGLTQLQTLNLLSTGVTDAGLEHLKGLKQLWWLWLFDTKVTYEGVKRLQQALPQCTLRSGPAHGEN